MYNLLYGACNYPMTWLPISLKMIKMRYWTYQLWTPSEEDPEKVYYDIPSETQSQKQPDIVTDSSNALSTTSNYNETKNKIWYHK